MKEATYQRAADIAKRASAITLSIEKLGHTPDKITLTMVEGEGDNDKQHEVLIYVEDTGNPNDVVCQIHQLLFGDLVKLRDQLKEEFENL